MSSFDLKAFCSIIQKHKITYTYVAPPVVLHLAKSPVVSEYDLSSLKMITSGAAPLTKELIYAVHDRLGTEVKQAYGLSETSPVTHMQVRYLLSFLASFTALTEPTSIQKKWNHALGSCDPPLPNQTVLFMSPDGKPVPTGTEGEVWIKGPNIFKGYYNNAEATSSSFTPDGFFKTGDIGYEDEDGNMYITDRVKELIKYKGFQVAPAELEGVLAGNDMVEDVAVIGTYDKSCETEVPLACVVLKGGLERSKVSEGKIVTWLGERVSGHKQLRGGIRWVDEVPKSASGKILRRVLKDWLKKVEEGERVKAKL
jgi:4-coumarate--CoA ligase